MKLYYYPETDSLYVEFQSRPAVDTREIAEDVRLDLDEQGRPVGLDIGHASAILNLEGLETAGLPVKTTTMRAGGAALGRGGNTEAAKCCPVKPPPAPAPAPSPRFRAGGAGADRAPGGPGGNRNTSSVAAAV